ncbi:hypothetical protein CEE45_07835 [Candidatus Heimdallarchaeota archaeon B3_Heim]|nr:MAG: hypothetical protein CEE45_07835 [Candidatus Heimdallarchaeota archaeon B3_Heim]
MNRGNFLHIIFFLFIIIPASPSSIQLSSGIDVTPETLVELNDVVKLNYTLWIETAIVERQNGTVWVHNPDDPNAPNELYEQFPDLTVPPNVGFLNAILGMKAGDTKTFDVLFSSGEAFNNITDPFYLEDLVYQVSLSEILLDTTEIPSTLFDLPFFVPFLFLVLLLLSIIIYYRIKRYGQSRNIFGSKTVCNSCNALATVTCGNPSCSTPFCKNCFIKNNHCTVCNSNKMIPLTGK